MTLALAGKSRKRKGGLLLAALLAVAVAVVAGATLREPGAATATDECNGCATIYIKKVTVGAPAPATYFTADVMRKSNAGTLQIVANDISFWSGKSPTASVSISSPDNGDFLVVEDPLAGWTTRAKKVISGADMDCEGEGSGPWFEGNPANATVSHLDDNEAVTVCFKNEPPRRITIKKVVNNVVNDPTEFDFKVDGQLTDPVAETSATGLEMNTQSTGAHVIEELPEAGYAVQGWYVYKGSEISCGESDVPQLASGTDATAEVPAATAEVTEVTVCFFNLRSENRLYVVKINLDGKKAGVKAQGIVSFQQAWALDHQEIATYDEYIGNGDYLVQETVLPPGYVFRGYAVVKNSPEEACPAEPSLSTNNVTVTFKADDATDNRQTVCVYNEPLVNVKVTKKEVHLAGSSPGEGWTMWLKGCGYDEPQLTGADGTYTWKDLPLCNYTVTEKAASKPGFTPLGPTSQTVDATKPGETYVVDFANLKDTDIPECTYNCEPPPPPSLPPPPLPPPPPPPPTQTVAGEKTPGPTEVPPTPTKPAEAKATPIAPSTGSGLAGGGTSSDLVLLFAGMIIVTGGLTLVAIGQRKRS